MKLPIHDLGPSFYDIVTPATFPLATPRFYNAAAAESVNLEPLSLADREAHFCRFKPLSDNLSAPLALRYHGHQFLNYNPDLGDGRGFLFAQLRDKQNRLLDLGTKGSGTTPYSRQGDGRLTLKGAVREVLATELLESLGAQTSKTFSVFETGESLIRYDEPSPTRSAVLVRLSHGHIRIGTFQRLAHHNDLEAIQKLVAYCLKYFFLDPEADAQLGSQTQALRFFQEVIRRCAQMVAEWMMTGFVHGVMNTDNINITGESFDYGPYRFLPKYDVRFTAAYFDQQGLYCFGRQPITMLWNLEQLGKALQIAWPVLPMKELLEEFSDEFNLATQTLFLRRLNLQVPRKKCTLSEEDSILLTQNTLHYFFLFLEKSSALYEQFFFDMHSFPEQERWMKSPQAVAYQGEEFEALKNCLSQFEIADDDKKRHLYFTRSAPCTLLIDEIENLWKPIAEKDDWSLFEEKIRDIQSWRGLY